MKKPLSSPTRAFFLLLTGLLVSGCVTMGHSSTLSAFDKAQRHFTSGSYDLAEREINLLINGMHGSLEGADEVRALRLRADCYRNLNRFTLARYDYEAARRLVTSLGPALSRSIAIDCDISIGEMSMYEGSYRIADQIFARIIYENPASEHKDSVLYRRYICAIKLKKPDPEEFTRQIADMYAFSSAALRREFLGQSGRTIAPPPRFRSRLHAS